ncbi:kinase-like domain-containing protein [Haematococcus lacustris]
MQQYELLGAVGQGQYGVAYKARHKLDGSLYCIKRIGLSAKDDQSSALKEAQLLSQLDHPNIIGYKESFIDPKDGALCIITTFCEEGDLFTRISKRRAANQFFSEHEIMDMFVQIASSLQYIHSKRILHRDLKTQNIFLSKGNIIKLGDFGISKVLEKTDQFATTVTGTPYYMAPEICTNQPYTFKSDIWSLGCVLYELCTLKHAFAADSLLSLVYQIVRGNFPPIPPNQFSQGLSNLVNALLVRDANQRPSLMQVIAMPYVHQSVQRYRQESQRNLEKQSSTMARRQQLLDKTGEAAAAQGLRGGAEEDAALTPKERLARNKERQRQQRELELKLASLNTAKEQGVAAQRKAAQIQGTNALGLPGSAAARSAAHQVAAAQQQQQGLLGYDEPPPATPSSAGAQLLQSSSGRRGGTNNPWNAVDPPNQQQQQGGGGMGDSMVNMGTMPGGGTLPLGSRTALRQAPPPGGGGMTPRGAGGAGVGGAGAGSWDAGGQTVYEAYENRPIRAGSRPSMTRAVLADMADDGVLMGTMAGATQTMVNMGTMNLGITSQGSFRAAAGSNPWALDDPGVTAPAATGHTTPRTPAVPGELAGGYKFGISNPSAMPSLPSFPPRMQHSTPSPQRSASPPMLLGNSKARAGNQDAQPSFEFPARDMRHSSGYEDDDDYEDDFEEYNPLALDDQETRNEKCKILSNMEDLVIAPGQGGLPNEDQQVREKVGVSARSSKAAALRDRCKQALGHHFASVYAYLRRVRSQEAASIDEAGVQRALHELVGQDKALLQGCFLTDQLVFQEMMFV